MRFAKPALILAVSLLIGTTLWAKPESGFGIYAGYASHSSKGEITEGAFQGLEYEVTSSGPSLGIDYQFALGDTFSLSIVWMSSAEPAKSDELIVDDAGHGMLGVQLKYWFGSTFAGVQAGNYSEILSSDEEGVSDIDGTGTGYGVVLGWESDKGGLFVTAQADMAKIKYSDAESDLTGYRLHVGYRFK